MLVALERASDLLEILRKTQRFAVNLLAGGQEDVGGTCAQEGRGQAGVGRRGRTSDGLPGSRARPPGSSCEVREYLPGGDHVIVVGLVTASEAGDEAQPLIYHRAGFCELA